MEADDIGIAAMLLGAGRATKDDKIDLAVGIVLKKKIGDVVKGGNQLQSFMPIRKKLNVDVTSSRTYFIGDEGSESASTYWRNDYKIIEMNTITKTLLLTIQVNRDLVKIAFFI